MVISLKDLINKTVKSSLLIILFGIIILFLINPNYINSFVIGVLIGLANFIISGEFLRKFLSTNNKINGLIFILSFAIRIILISIIGLFLLLQSKYKLILYLIGYMSNFISLFISIKGEERK